VLQLFQGQMRLQVRMERQNLGGCPVVHRLERLLHVCRGRLCASL
jgi:hypothetical protein